MSIKKTARQGVSVLLIMLSIIFTACISLDCLHIVTVPEIDTQAASKIYSLDFSPEGNYLAAGCVRDSGRQLSLVDLESSPPRAYTLPGHSDVVYCVAFDPLGRYLASASRDKTVKIWNLKTRTILYELSAHEDIVYAVTFDPFGQVVISGGADNKIRIWSMEDGTLLRTLEGHTDAILILKVNWEKRIILSGSKDKTVRIWDLKTGVLLNTLSGHTEMVTGLTCSPDGSRIISGSTDDTVKIWDYNSGVLLHDLKEHTDDVNLVRMSPVENQMLSAGKDGRICVWDITSGELIEMLSAHFDSIEGLALDLLGKYFVSGGLDRTLHLWNLKTRQRLCSFYITSDALLALTPDNFLAGDREYDFYVKYAPEYYNEAKVAEALVVESLPGALRALKEHMREQRKMEELLEEYEAGLDIAELTLEESKYITVPFQLSGAGWLKFSFNVLSGPLPYMVLITRENFESWNKDSLSLPETVHEISFLRFAKVIWAVEDSGDYLLLIGNFNQNEVIRINYAASLLEADFYTNRDPEALALDVYFGFDGSVYQNAFLEDRLVAVPNYISNFDLGAGLDFDMDSLHYDAAFLAMVDYSLVLSARSSGNDVAATIYEYTNQADGTRKLVPVESLDAEPVLETTFKTQAEGEIFFIRFQVENDSPLMLDYAWEP